VFTTEKLQKRLTELDETFEESSIPFKERALEAFKAIHGSVRDQADRARLFDPIIAWFTEKYGEKAKWDGIMGRVPVLVRGDLYLAMIRFVVEDQVQDYRDCIEGLPTEVSKNLGLEDFKSIASYTSRAQMYLNAIQTLQADDCFLTKPQRDFMLRGRFDLRGSPLSLKLNEDTQSSIFSAHAAAEKFLKAAIIGIDPTMDARSYGHKADKLFSDLAARDPRFRSLGRAVDELQSKLGQGMNIRYSTANRSVEQAVSIFYAALHLCSSVSNILRFDDERGSRNSAFSAGAYYVNSVNLSFWCTKADETSATIIAFDTGGLRDLAPHAISLKQTESGYYLRVTNASQLSDMSHALSRAAMRSRPLGTDEVNEISNIRGTEGSYILGFSRRRRK
jgi:hypothetical protein